MVSVEVAPGSGGAVVGCLTASGSSGASSILPLGSLTADNSSTIGIRGAFFLSFLLLFGCQSNEKPFLATSGWGSGAKFFSCLSLWEVPTRHR